MTKDDIIPKERIASSIFYIRKKKVIFDRDLAELYDVETRQLKRAVRRNISRFPDDFMFELNKLELHNLRSHFGTSSWGGTRHAPMAFTEQGVAMLSSVLNSERAIQVNIQINRTFPGCASFFRLTKTFEERLSLWSGGTIGSSRPCSTLSSSC